MYNMFIAFTRVYLPKRCPRPFHGLYDLEGTQEVSFCYALQKIWKLFGLLQREIGQG